MGFLKSKKGGHVSPSSGSSVKQTEAGMNIPFDHTSTDIAAIMANPNLDDSKVPKFTIRTFIMAVIAAMGG